MVEESFKDLAWKCYQYNLRFEYVPISEGVTVFNEKYNLITSGWMDGVREKELSRMHIEVDLYLKAIGETHDTEHAQAELTQQKRGKSLYEQKLEEAGHKERDFL